MKLTPRRIVYILILVVILVILIAVPIWLGLGVHSETGLTAGISN